MRAALWLAGLLAVTMFGPAISAEPNDVAPAPPTVPREGPVDPGSLSDLIGRDLKARDGETVGEVDDVVVLDGDRTSLVVSVGAFLGFGGKLVVLPYDAISIGGDELQVNMTEGQLEQQPAYDPETSEGVSLKRGERSR